MKFSKPIQMMTIAAAVLMLSACGKAQFAKQDFQASAVAGQYVTTKPKIDVIVFQDNSDSVMYGPIEALKPQMNSFLTSMSADWDLHFTVLPLLSQKSVTGKYVVASNCSEISGTVGCLTPSQSTTFNNSSGDYGWIRSVVSGIGSNDKGFYNMYANLQHSSMTSTGFLRSDAALAIIVLSNGEDIDGMSYTTRNDGFQELDYNSGVSTYNSYRNYFQSIKPSSSLRRFYSVVCPGGTCYNYGSIRGQRYMNMADDLGSRSYNLCNNELNSALSSMKQQLVAVAEAVRFNYVVMNEKPMVSSIKVTKNGVTIPQSSSNGWTYVGYLANQATSYSPTSGNVRSGYFIKLNGTAEYKGSEKIDISFQKE